jgi:nucleotide-binding universal stress UspA family protein
MYDKILVTLDGSSLAESALPHAETMARQFGAALTLLQVVPSPVTLAVGYYDHVSVEVLEALRDTALEQAEAYIERQVAALEEQGMTVSGQVVEGEPVECILHFAEELSADLIVMATHGRSGLGRWVFGSVAERVLHGAQSPVLLVRARE